MRTSHYRSITGETHRRAAACLREGDCAVDATSGKGHDTVALARFVGATGRDYALDLQPVAIAATSKRLNEADLADRVTVLQADHADLTAV